MKIEIGEFLILSWLRHVRGCVLTQMNWSPSPAWPVARERQLGTAFEAVQELCVDATGRRILEDRDVGAFVRDARIDVLGLRLDRATRHVEAIAVDSAINDDELPHGDAEETIVRLIQRMLRAGFALAAYLNPPQVSVVFATPWLAQPIREEVQRRLARLEARLAGQRHPAVSRLRFRVIADGDFADEIVQPVLEHVDTLAATSGPVGNAARAGNGAARPGSTAKSTAKRPKRPSRGSTARSTAQPVQGEGT